MPPDAPDPSTPAGAGDTRTRILEFAGEVFAEHGFRDATIREICQRAGANVAAVNYHFGDKEHLYLAVLHFANDVAARKYPSDYGLRDEATAEERLLAFVRSFLLRIFDNGRFAWHGKLVAREFIEPTRALDELVERVIRPRFALLSSIISELLPPEMVTSDRVRRCAGSIVGQCLHYHHARPIMERLGAAQEYEVAHLDELARHITSFSLAALRNLAETERAVRLISDPVGGIAAAQNGGDWP